MTGTTMMRWKQRKAESQDINENNIKDLELNIIKSYEIA